jgi:predicted GNAT superfamily acetyltransferase
MSAAVGRAFDASERASVAAGVEVRPLDSTEDLAAAAELFTDTWATPERHPPTPFNVLRALSFSGSYVAGAYRHDLLVGGSVAFLANVQGDFGLFSHSLAVGSIDQSKGIGYAIKQHQRYWTLERGMRFVWWTFDPLIVRNAYLNTVKLGAVGRAFLPDFYGSMKDRLNSGRVSHRLLAVWQLDSERAEAAAAKHLTSPACQTGTADADLPADAHPGTGDGMFVLRAPGLTSSDPAVRARSSRPALEGIEAAIASGFDLTKVDKTGTYTFSRRATCV